MSSLEKSNNLPKVTKLVSVVSGFSSSALTPKLITALYTAFFHVYYLLIHKHKIAFSYCVNSDSLEFFVSQGFFF